MVGLSTCVRLMVMVLMLTLSNRRLKYFPSILMTTIPSVKLEFFMKTFPPEFNLENIGPTIQSVI